jgi:hypothetical protein
MYIASKDVLPNAPCQVSESLKCRFLPLHSFLRPFEATYFPTMFSKIAPFLAFVASANAHGYLSSPMSRTGLNAQVSFFVQWMRSTTHVGSS